MLVELPCRLQGLVQRVSMSVLRQIRRDLHFCKALRELCKVMKGRSASAENANTINAIDAETAQQTDLGRLKRCSGYAELAHLDESLEDWMVALTEIASQLKTLTCLALQMTNHAMVNWPARILSSAIDVWYLDLPGAFSGMSESYKDKADRLLGPPRPGVSRSVSLPLSPPLRQKQCITEQLVKLARIKFHMTSRTASSSRKSMDEAVFGTKDVRARAASLQPCLKRVKSFSPMSYAPSEMTPSPTRSQVIPNVLFKGIFDKMYFKAVHGSRNMYAPYLDRFEDFLGPYMEFNEDGCTCCCALGSLDYPEFHNLAQCALRIAQRVQKYASNPLVALRHKSASAAQPKVSFMSRWMPAAATANGVNTVLEKQEKLTQLAENLIATKISPHVHSALETRIYKAESYVTLLKAYVNELSVTFRELEKLDLEAKQLIHAKECVSKEGISNKPSGGEETLFGTPNFKQYHDGDSEIRKSSSAAPLSAGLRSREIGMRAAVLVSEILFPAAFTPHDAMKKPPSLASDSQDSGCGRGSRHYYQGPNEQATRKPTDEIPSIGKIMMILSQWKRFIDPHLMTQMHLHHLDADDGC
ncbi:hypothetical protein GNI_157120 [Gregarina niphandrodes]|uniref:Uncharacterized protein n=1 Tax=Gregarina niphandrodes TaxID=110365 RepID=A0A023AZ21_GRENI|nr:hypothetical protein GNI_157120 [Gregarina niphandrodes]EZG43872.1 hypothetical protein GNI_157120 [Gregarina niphandrodes]|eukprot:XP_011132960.1 hypothetical protein GNI_157120 [Gregarina niphandrodes]